MSNALQEKLDAWERFAAAALTGIIGEDSSRTNMGGSKTKRAANLATAMMEEREAYIQELKNNKADPLDGINLKP